MVLLDPPMVYLILRLVLLDSPIVSGSTPRVVLLDPPMVYLIPRLVLLDFPMSLLTPTVVLVKSEKVIGP